MKTLDKYLVKEFLRTFVVMFLASSVLFIVIDIIDQLSKMLRYGATLEQAALYYILRLPYLLTLTSPVIMLLTGLFLMNTLAKYNESIAVRAAGISIKRMLLPLIIIGFVVSIAIGWFGDYVLPKAEERREHLYQVEIKKGQARDRMLRTKIFFQEGSDVQNYVAFFNGHTNEMKVIDKTIVAADFSSILYKSEATSAVWDEGEWKYNQLYQRKFDKGKLVDYQQDKEFVGEVMNVTPLEFIRSGKPTLSMNYRELSQYIARLKKLNDNYSKELVDLYMKISFPLANLIILFFSFPIVTSSTRSKNRGYVFMLGLAVCFTFLITVEISRSLGYSEVLPPLVAAWAPNIIFAVVGVFFLYKAEV